MKKKMLLVLSIIWLLATMSPVSAGPLNVEEINPKIKSKEVSPLYATIPGNFEVVTKKINGSFVIFYLSENDSVLSISESYYQGQEINQSDKTEIIIKGDVKYFYSPFINRSGGSIAWIKDDILFEMNSVYFDKNTMLNYATTLK
ncbi:hypothetical protein EL84_23105 [Paenibacillus sp. VT-400]|uniref:hypothetical protein n=1 Tax=Paenibacillus sp. VT-400 TaxID=1495853 RepID=UPI00064AD638|nr:hypothetical protein [Paenibacillus sp. VT-400]KLU54990.1 hypothetical protein EL84_23105 [Paenibacillus sp. VT-400]